ncbi:MAG: PDZ domain-containing protein [Granulosicoccus sp.]
MRLVIALVAGVAASVCTLAATRYLSESMDKPFISPNSAIELSDPVSIETANFVAGDGTRISHDKFQKYDKKLRGLQDEIAQANLEREALVERVQSLADELALLSDNPELNSFESQHSSVFAGDAASPFPSDVLASGFPARTSAEQRFESLIAAGLDVQTAQAFTERKDQFMLSRLELVDEATRDDWLDSEAFDDRLEELESEQVSERDELGDEGYDRYLYELGRANRVGIASVITGSAAEGAGLEAGDIVLSYANKRIFNMHDLQDATRAGNRGEYVPLALVRNDEPMIVDIPRGPMGVTLSSIRIRPG